MKKLTALLVSLLMTASLAGCGAAASSSEPTPAPESGSPSSSSAAEPAPADEKLKIGIVQIVEHPSLDEIRTAFMDQMAQNGYGEDKVEFDYQNAQNDTNNVNSICQKFVGDGVDMIVAIATPSAQGAAASTKDIPVIFSAVTDPVAAELVTDPKAPEGNVTGTSDNIPADKIFTLADELTPGIKTYGFVYNLGEVNSVSVINQAKAYLDSKGVKYVEGCVTNIGEVTQAAQSLVGKVDAIFAPIDNTVASAMANLADVALQAKLPVYVAADTMVKDGGLATVGINYTNLGKQTADMAVKVLTGTPISQVPVEVLSEYSVLVNPDTAAALGVDVTKYAK